MSDDFNPVAFGRLEARVESYEDRLCKIESKLDTIIAALERQKGVRWAFGAVIGTAASGMTHLFHKYFQ